MSTGRRDLILARLLAGGGDEGTSAARLCEVCSEMAGVSGAGVMLMSGDEPWGSVCTTDERSTLIE